MYFILLQSLFYGNRKNVGLFSMRILVNGMFHGKNIGHSFLHLTISALLIITATISGQSQQVQHAGNSTPSGSDSVSYVLNTAGLATNTPQRVQSLAQPELGFADCRKRLAVNISSGSLAAVSIVGAIVTQIVIRKKMDEALTYDNALKATREEIKWERITALRGISAAAALLSTSVFAISVVIPVGKDDCKSRLSSRIKERQLKRRSREKKS